MQGNCTKFLLNLIMMLAFIGAGISPACKFISGELVEICGPNGIETVRLAADEIPPDAPDHHKSASEQCAFCFTGSHIKTMGAQAATVEAPVSTRIAAEHEIAAVHAYDLYRSATLPRGPPSAV